MAQSLVVKLRLGGGSIEPGASPSFSPFTAAAAPTFASAPVGRPPSDFALSIQQREALVSRKKGSLLAPKQQELGESARTEMSASQLERDQHWVEELTRLILFYRAVAFSFHRQILLTPLRRRLQSFCSRRHRVPQHTGVRHSSFTDHVQLQGQRQTQEQPTCTYHLSREPRWLLMVLGRYRTSPLSRRNSEGDGWCDLQGCLENY